MYLFNLALSGVVDNREKMWGILGYYESTYAARGLLQVYHSNIMIKCNCEEKNFIKFLAEKVHQKMNAGNETQLLMMCTYQSIKMDIYTDMYRRT